MATSLIPITGGSGYNLHTWNRTDGSSVEDQLIVPGEPWKLTYSIVASSISTATSASHVLQIMGDASNYVRIERLKIKQVTSAGSAAMLALQVLRLTTAGTGGSAITARPHDTADAAFGGAAMTLPSAKGTEGVQLDLIDFPLRSAIVAGEQESVTTFDLDLKPWVIPTGTSNGICLKAVTGVATATISVVAVVGVTVYL